MNYTELLANIQNFLEDDSTELSTSIPTIITQAENLVFQRLPSLPCFRNVTTGTPIMYSTKNATTSGTIVALAPTPSATLAYQVDFIAPETGLSTSNATSWVGTHAENVLLSASLYESSAFLKSPETLKLYKEQFDEAITLFQQEMGRVYSAEYDGGI